MIPFFFFSVVAILAGLYFTRTNQESTKDRAQFFKKGKEAGFNIRDLEQLKQLASDCKLKASASIFTSHKLFVLIIRNMINAARMSGEINDPPVQDFLSRLFDHCKKLEMQANDNKSRITTSRQIVEGQSLKVLVPGVGVYKSELVKNFGNYLTISRPVNSKLAASMQWTGLRISIYFWREDDAGYVFDTDVIDEVFSKGISALKVEHHDSLFRTQKRKSVRIKFKKMAFLYLVDEISNPHTLEKSAGLRCMLDDISDTGCAFRVNGQAVVGLRLKVQFSLNRVPVCMPGTVRAVEYNREVNNSLVRMEADTLPIGIRNLILCEVFDLLPEEDEEELPFRVTDDESNTTAPQGDNNAADKQQEAMNV